MCDGSIEFGCNFLEIFIWKNWVFGKVFFFLRIFESVVGKKKINLWLLIGSLRNDNGDDSVMKSILLVKIGNIIV